jgi:hypothetical protein
MPIDAICERKVLKRSLDKSTGPAVFQRIASVPRLFLFDWRLGGIRSAARNRISQRKVLQRR